MDIRSIKRISKSGGEYLEVSLDPKDTNYYRIESFVDSLPCGAVFIHVDELPYLVDALSEIQNNEFHSTVKENI